MKRIFTFMAAILMAVCANASVMIDNFAAGSEYSYGGSWAGNWFNQGDMNKDVSEYDYIYIKYSGLTGKIGFGIVYSEWQKKESWGDVYYTDAVVLSQEEGVVGIAIEKTKTYEVGVEGAENEYKGDIYAKHVRQVYLQDQGIASTIKVEGIWYGSQAEYEDLVKGNTPEYDEGKSIAFDEYGNILASEFDGLSDDAKVEFTVLAEGEATKGDESIVGWGIGNIKSLKGDVNVGDLPLMKIGDNVYTYTLKQLRAALEDAPDQYNRQGLYWNVWNQGNATCTRKSVVAYDVVEEAESSMIVFEENADAGTLDGKTFTVGDLTLSLVDTAGKMVIDDNNAYFGTADEYQKFSKRLKSGGKSSSKNSMTLSVPSAGTLKVYARTASSSATDRNLVLTQGETELYNQVVQDADAIEVVMGEGEEQSTKKVYPVISVAVEAGEVAVGYPTGALNFYAFEFVAGEAAGETIIVNGENVPVVKTFTVNHNEVEKTVYSGTTEEFDVNAVVEALGISAIGEAAQYIVNVTTNEAVENTTDGWRNASGDAETWGTSAGMVCVKIQDPASGLIDYIGCIDDTHVAGETYTAKWAFVADNKAAVIDVVITFVEPEEVELEISENVQEASVEYETTEASYVEKQVVLTDDQVAAICTELGISALADATVYGYNPTTKELVSNYGAYDGWRNASGDFQSWTGTSEVPACVKYTDGKTYLCYNINGCEPQTIDCYWAIANDTKAVLVKVAFNYVVPAGISELNADEQNNVIYNLNGVRMQNTQQKGIY
ncbi:MAG: hypothetical protein K6C10_04510, partial [Prevotella sp.]|nr:hypothetical protein [Prevotella sp.]